MGLAPRLMNGNRSIPDSCVPLGFGRAKHAHACLCTLRGLAVSVHGNDFTTAGPKYPLDWFEDKLEAKYELKKSGRLGPGHNDSKELIVLNRVLRWTSSGVEYEADPRHRENLLEGLGLDGGCMSAATPGLKAVIEQLIGDKPVSQYGHTRCRGLAARANSLLKAELTCSLLLKKYFDS